MRTNTRTLALCALLGATAIEAGLSRHNEQGLSPTHSYKRSGVGGVVSNLNGNLVVSSAAISKFGAPLGVSLSRTWNSHWRDALFTYQYDMNYNVIDLGDPAKRRPTFHDRDISGVQENLDIGGFAVRRFQRYDTPAGVPSTWAFAQSVSLNLLNLAVQHGVQAILQQKYGYVMWKYQYYDYNQLSSAEQALVNEAQMLQAAGYAFSMGIYLVTGGTDDLKTLSECLKSATGEISSAKSDCGDATMNVAGAMFGNSLTATVGSVNLPLLSMAQMGYNLAKGDMTGEDLAWQVGSMVAQHLATSITSGGLAGGVAGMAAATVIQSARMYIQLQLQWAQSFDVGVVTVRPWAQGVNGYLGMLGTNHEHEYQKAQSRFNRSWRTPHTVTDTVTITDPETGKQSTQQVERIEWSTTSESRHPMSDLQLAGTDGGASRFILSDDTARTVDGLRWVSYTSLSNGDQRKVYYCLPAGIPDQSTLPDDPTGAQQDSARLSDSSGYYLVKEPDGTQVQFGMGAADKGIVPDEAGFHTYWSVPSRVSHPSGDTIRIVRAADHSLKAAWDVRTGRGTIVESFGVIDGIISPDGLLVRGVDTIWTGHESHRYNTYNDKYRAHYGDVSVVNWEAKRISESQIDTTWFEYANGDMVSINYANGSRTSYSYTSNRADHRDGFVLSEKEISDRADSSFYRQRVYDYVGWDDTRPQALKTSVTTILRHPDHVVNSAKPWRESQQTDWYYFSPMVSGTNVNRALAGFQGRTTVFREDGTVHDTDKVVDSLEYRTSRFQLVAEYHGAGSPGLVRKQYIYDGDLLRAQIESRGLGNSYDPRITVWEYDEQGSRVRERLCPSDLQESVRNSIKGIPGAANVSFKTECPEVETRFGVKHRIDGEFWQIRRDTLRVPDPKQGGTLKSVVDVTVANPSFRPDSLFQVGLPTSTRKWRTDELSGAMSQLIGDSTEWEDWRVSPAATALPRAVRTRSYDPGKLSGDDWPVTGMLGYADDRGRPTLVSRTWRTVGRDSASLVETEYDATFALYPETSRAFVSPVALGQSGSGAVLTSKKDYDTDHGWVLSETDPGNRTTTTRYDRSGRVTEKTAPDGGMVTTSYVDRLEGLSSWRSSASVPGYASNYPNQRTVAVREMDQAGVTTEARFDGMGRLVAVRRLAKGAAFDTKDTAQQQTTLVSYNAFDKLSWKRDGAGRQEFHDYDGTGRLVSSKVYLQPDAASALSLSWEHRYDWRDAQRELVETDPQGTRTVFHWDGLGRDTLIERDSDLLEIQATGEQSAGLNSSGGASRIRVRQRYDNLGNVVQVTDPKGLVEHRKYDARNRLTETVYPDDIRHALGYDLGGRIVRDTVQQLRNGVSVSDAVVVKALGYDGQDRVLSETWQRGGTPGAASGFTSREDVAFHWDSHQGTNAPGLLVAMNRGTGVSSLYGYDVAGRRSSRTVESPEIGYQVTQTTSYDKSGSPVELGLPGGSRQRIGYDSYHRATRLSQVLESDSVMLWQGARYLSNDLQVGYGQGNRLETNFQYESRRPLLTENLITRTSPSAKRDTLYRQGLAWDAAGNVSGMRRGLGDSVGFQHDRLGQLRITLRKDGYDTLSYDLNGNRSRQRYTMDGGIADSFRLTGNRITSLSSARKGTTVYRFDVRGNQSLEADFAVASDTLDASKAWRVVERRYNGRDELERVVVKNRLRGDSAVWAYSYDEGSNRIAKRWVSLPISSGDTSWQFERKYAYDGVNMVADSGHGDSSWSWWGFQGYKRLAWVDRPASGGALRVRYLLTDHLGSANALVDDTGAVLSRYVLDPWGNVESAWETVPLRYRFTGKEHDPEVGGNVTYVNARYLDNERGVWLGRDPKLQFWSPYNYAGNGALVGVDPDGRVILYTGDAAQIAFSKKMISRISTSSRGAALVDALQCNERVYTIVPIRRGEAGLDVGYSGMFASSDDLVIRYDPISKIYSKTTKGLLPITPEIQLAHEMGHAVDDMNGRVNFAQYSASLDGKLEIEIKNIKENENPVRVDLGHPERLESAKGYEIFNF